MERTEKMQDLARETCQILDKFGLDNVSFYYQVQAGAMDEIYWCTMRDGEEQSLDHPSDLGLSHSDSLDLFTAIMDVDYPSILLDGLLNQTGYFVFTRMGKTFWQVDWERSAPAHLLDLHSHKQSYRLCSTAAFSVSESSWVARHENPVWG